MKILLIHYRYSVIGGPERYLFNVKAALEEKGHEVIPFSVAYPDNEPSEYEKYFVTPLTNEFHLHKAKLSIFKSLSIARKIIYNKEAYYKLLDLIDDVKPDIAYVLIYKGKLTYSIFDALKKSKIPAVLRISSFSSFCGINNFYRDNKICTKCLNNKFSLIKYKCMHNSYLFSIMSFIMIHKEKRSAFFDCVKDLICPSKFTANFYKKDSLYNQINIIHLPTFSNIDNYQLSNDNILKRYNSNVICFIGRVSEEKGISLLINALIQLKEKNINLKAIITGFSNNKYSNDIKEKIRTNKLDENIECFDFIDKDAIYNIIDNSYISIIPSICYDNMPNSLIESQSFGVPVVASNIGSFPELINEKQNGLLFDYNSEKDLSLKIKEMLDLDFEEYKKYSFNSYEWAKEYCSKDKHIESLLSVFSKHLNKQ